MKRDEFIQYLKSRCPKTLLPIVLVPAIPLDDGLWVEVTKTTSKDSDPIKTAKVIGILNQYNKDGEINIAMLEKEKYSNDDLERAIALIKEADVF